MKRLIREFEHLKGLFSELPPFLKRRITMEDLEWLDRELGGHINVYKHIQVHTYFDTFVYDVLADLLHEFVVHRKEDEIETVEDPHYGLIYSEDGFNDVASIYWKLMPYLKKRYEIKLRQAWERKKSR